MPAAVEMKDHVYKILDLVGSSEKSIEDAIQNAITRASKTIREMKWFEVVQTRGHIENGTIRHYEVFVARGIYAGRVVRAAPREFTATQLDPPIDPSARQRSDHSLKPAKAEGAGERFEIRIALLLGEGEAGLGIASLGRLVADQE
jgi:dodecin